MPKKSVKIEVNNFVQGLITEASPLNFPPNSTVDEENFVLHSDGTRSRRPGLDFEEDYSLISVPVLAGELEQSTSVPYEWTTVEGDADTDFIVIQFKNYLYIYDLGFPSISARPAAGTVDLSGLGAPDKSIFAYANVDGKLVIASGATDIGIISYENGVFSLETKSIKVRDVWGVEVIDYPRYENEIQYRNVDGSFQHIYNLYNQSWGIPRQSNAGGAYVDPVALYRQASDGKFPSNSETVWPGLQFQPVSAGAAPFERVFPELYNQVFGADIKAARGHFIIDLLRRGASRTQNIYDMGQQYPMMGMTSFNTKADITPGGATTVCEFAGRVFYAGFTGDVIDPDRRSPMLANFILFSQLVKNSADIAKCYQEGDPTSRESNDLVDTDGGFIRLSGASQIVKMINIGSALVVFAKNGVWIVSGGSDYGFNATNYKAEKISAFGVIGRDSVIEDGSRALYWSEDGIYVVSKNQLGDYSAENISQKTIQSFYNDIPSTSKEKSVGISDPIGKKIRWMYHMGNRFSSDSQSMELILDITIGAFYSYRIGNLPDYSVEVLAPFSSVPFTVLAQNADIAAGLDMVYSDVSPVSVLTTARKSAIMDTRYLIARKNDLGIGMTFGYYNNRSFLDWEKSDGIGVDAAAYLVTGAVTGGDSSVHKQIPYLTMHMERTERMSGEGGIPLNQSSCYVSSQWEWSSSSNSNKWSPRFQVYRYRKAYLSLIPDSEYDNGFELVTTKNKVRGRGRAFAFRMETEPLKDCKIVGWSLSVNGNANT